jgi:hypothetical protein
MDRPTRMHRSIQREFGHFLRLPSILSSGIVF